MQSTFKNATPRPSPALLALLAALVTWVALSAGIAPLIEPWFMASAARLAGLYQGITPVFLEAGGWLLALPGLDLRVTPACSGTAFFAILCSLGLWLYLVEQQYRRSLLPLLLLPVGAAALTIVLNAMRITLAGECYRMLEPVFGAPWQTRIHLALGVLTFLPALILSFLALRMKWTRHER